MGKGFFRVLVNIKRGFLETWLIYTCHAIALVDWYAGAHNPTFWGQYWKHGVISARCWQVLLFTHKMPCFVVFLVFKQDWDLYQVCSRKSTLFLSLLCSKLMAWNARWHEICNARLCIASLEWVWIGFSKNVYIFTVRFLDLTICLLFSFTGDVSSFFHLKQKRQITFTKREYCLHKVEMSLNSC